MTREELQLGVRSMTEHHRVPLHLAAFRYMMVIYRRAEGVIDLTQFEGFEWDRGNDTKNWKKHRVTREECEEVFFNSPLLLGSDATHSKAEDRYYVLGKTDAGRRLFVAFAGRGSLIRVISARDMTEKERKMYHGR